MGEQFPYANPLAVKILIKTQPNLALINDNTKEQYYFFKLTAKIAGLVVPTEVGIKLDITILRFFEFCFRIMYVPTYFTIMNTDQSG